MAWAKVKGDLPVNGLNPHCWYEVVDDDDAREVTVHCPELEAQFRIHRTMVEVSERAPSKAIVAPMLPMLEAVPAGAQIQPARYRAWCPERHDLGEVADGVQQVFCPVCKRTFETEEA